MSYVNKCPKIPDSTIVKKRKVIRNPHTDPDHQQKLITSVGLPLAHACQVWSMSLFVFIWMTDRTFT